MATIDGVRFTRDAVVLDLDPDGDASHTVLEHDEAVELAAELVVHVALGAIDAGEVIDPDDELNRIVRAVAARAVAMLCEALPRLREIRAIEVGIVERSLVGHAGGGEATERRAPELAVVRGDG